MAEALRTWPGAVHSGHPEAGVAAVGREAEAVALPHPLDDGYGTGTPYARVVERDGQVVLLGAPLDTIDFRWVNGQMYTRLRPLVGGQKAARKPPPTPILKLLTRIHPELRRREKRAAAVMENEPWQRVIADWHGGMKAGIEDGNLAAGIVLAAASIAIGLLNAACMTY